MTVSLYRRIAVSQDHNVTSKITKIIEAFRYFGVMNNEWCDEVMNDVEMWCAVICDVMMKEERKILTAASIGGLT